MDAAREGPEHPLGRGPAATSPPFGHRSRGRGRARRRGRYARPGLGRGKRPFRVAGSRQPVGPPAWPHASCASGSHEHGGAIKQRGPTPCTTSGPGRGRTRWPGSRPARRPPPLVGRRRRPAAPAEGAVPRRPNDAVCARKGLLGATWVRSCQLGALSWPQGTPVAPANTKCTQLAGAPSTRRRPIYQERPAWEKPPAHGMPGEPMTCALRPEPCAPPAQPRPAGQRGTYGHGQRPNRPAAKPPAEP